MLEALVAATRAGSGQVLVLRGEAGIGKTALLSFLTELAPGLLIARAAGAASEMDIPYAGLHQLCSPFLDRLETLPEPQRAALSGAFGLKPAGELADLLVGLAALSLLRDVAQERPVVCVVDDAQWLDEASIAVLRFVVRRLAGDPVAVVIAVRECGEQRKFAGLPELDVPGLAAADATAVLQAVTPGGLDLRVRDRLLAEARGNPLALLESPLTMTPSGTLFERNFTTSGSTYALAGLEETLREQIAALEPAHRLLLLVASADPFGDANLLSRAAARLGIGRDVPAWLETAGWIEFREHVVFCSPFARSAVYQSASVAERRQIHQALADATDPNVDLCAYVWHRTCAATAPDESAARQLEQVADAARAGNHLATEALLSGIAAAMTSDPSQQARRSLVAAEAAAIAGAPAKALALLGAPRLDGTSCDEFRARVDLCRAQIHLGRRLSNDAVATLMSAAQRLALWDSETMREAVADALADATFAGFAITQGAQVALSPADGVRPGWAASVAAMQGGDDVRWDTLSRTHLAQVRASGAAGLLSRALAGRAYYEIQTGNVAGAGLLVAEARWVADVTHSGDAFAALAEDRLAATLGCDGLDPRLGRRRVHSASAEEEFSLNGPYAARAFACNGLGRYEDALTASREAPVRAAPFGPAFVLGELVEAAVRSGRVDLAAEAFEQLSAMTTASGTTYALGIRASKAALLHGDDAAEDLHREALTRLGSTRMRIDLARAQLVYGEWLRRKGRRLDARAQLRAAHEAFSAMGVVVFAERARRELSATGETVRKRTVDMLRDLTAQESNIARLAVEGLTNAEIAAQLYLSPRTVEWHLGKVFAKVGVADRRHLRRSFQPSGGMMVPQSSAKVRAS